MPKKSSIKIVKLKQKQKAFFDLNVLFSQPH